MKKCAALITAVSCLCPMISNVSYAMELSVATSSQNIQSVLADFKPKGNVLYRDYDNILVDSALAPINAKGELADNQTKLIVPSTFSKEEIPLHPLLREIDCLLREGNEIFLWNVNSHNAQPTFMYEGQQYIFVFDSIGQKVYLMNPHCTKNVVRPIEYGKIGEPIDSDIVELTSTINFFKIYSFQKGIINKFTIIINRNITKFIKQRKFKRVLMVVVPCIVALASVIALTAK